MRKIYWHILFVIGSIIYCSSLFAQSIPANKSRLSLRISPMVALPVFLEDTIAAKNLGDYLLDTGSWNVKMWQSGYEVLDTTIVLQGGKHLLLKNKMIEMTEFIQYKQDFTKYLNRKAVYYSLPIVPILASIHFTNQFVKRYNTAQSEMDYYYEQSLFSKQRIETTMNYEEYMSSLAFFDGAQRQYINFKDQRDKLLPRYLIYMSAIAVGTTTLYLLLKKPVKPVKPIFKNPLANASIDLNYISGGLCLSIGKKF